MKNKPEIDKLFREVLETKDYQKVSDFVFSPFPNLTQEEKIAYYTKLLKYDWHYMHDQIVSFFQSYSNHKTVDILYETALNEKIDLMEYKPIARRCTWALADIGTDEAKEKLTQLANCGNELIEGFAQKRLTSWEKEIPRKGMKIGFHRGSAFVKLDYYENLKAHIEHDGKQIVTGYQTENDIIVYQAYNPQIAAYAIEHQKFGGSNYSFNRMTWIKPNFLWMMYRCGWASKPNQERVLAISISKDFFIKLLREGQVTSMKQAHYKEESIWRKFLNTSEVRIQWDPHHRPDESKLERKAIQIGIKGGLQKEFGTKQINFIKDITHFVKEQKMYIDRGDYPYLKIPIEHKMEILDESIIEKLSIAH